MVFVFNCNRFITPQWFIIVRNEQGCETWSHGYAGGKDCRAGRVTITVCAAKLKAKTGSSVCSWEWGLNILDVCCWILTNTAHIAYKQTHVNILPNSLWMLPFLWRFHVSSNLCSNSYLICLQMLYQSECLTISKLLLSVTESLEYFPITPWQRCKALMSLPVLCVHLIAHPPPSLCFTSAFSWFVTLFFTVKQLTFTDLWM